MTLQPYEVASLKVNNPYYFYDLTALSQIELLIKNFGSGSNAEHSYNRRRT